MTPYYQDDFCIIYNDDCRNVIPSLPQVDLVLTDPPYGIGYEAKKSNLPGAKEFGTITGDSSEQDFSHLFAIDAEKVIFGAENFYSQLPHRGRWLCWDKRVDPNADKMLGSPFELAWMSKTSGYYRIVRLMHGGVVNADRQVRKHPTQKPSNLMTEILKMYPHSVVVLDPYMGSGSTLRAAKDMKKKSIGIEIEERYCEIAAKRLAQEVLL